MVNPVLKFIIPLMLVVGLQLNYAHAQSLSGLSVGPIKIGMDYHRAADLMIDACGVNFRQLRRGGNVGLNCIEVNGIKRTVEIYADHGSNESIVVAIITVVLGGYSENKLARIDSELAFKYQRLAIVGDRNAVLEDPRDRRAKAIVSANGQVVLDINQISNKIILTYSNSKVARHILDNFGL